MDTPRNPIRSSLFVLALLLAGCGGGGGGIDGGEPLPGGGLPPQPGQMLKVIAADPAHESADLELDAALAVTFSSPLDPTSFPTPPLLVRENGIVVPGQIDHDAAARTLTFTPLQPFAHRAAIQLTVEAGIADLDGETMTEDVVLDYTTRLPRLGTDQDLVSTPDYERVLAFAMNGNGDGALAYADAHPNDLGALHIARFQAGVGFVGSEPMSSGYRMTVSDAMLRIADNGDIAVAWRYENGGQRDVLARIYDAGTGTWSNVTALEISPAGTAIAVEVGISATGHALFGWTRAPLGASVADRVYAKAWHATNGWTGTFGLGAGTGDIRDLSVAMSSTGRGLVAWSEDDVDGTRARGTRWSAANGWSVRETFDALAPSSARVEDTVVDANGRIAVLVREERTPTEQAPWAVRYDANATMPGWQAPERLDDDYGTAVGGGHAVVDPAGRITFAWGASHGTESTLRVRRRAPGGPLAPLTVFAPKTVWWSHGVFLDVAEDGTVAVGSQERANDVRRVHAAVWSPTTDAWSPLEVVATERYDHFRPAYLRAWRGGFALAAWIAADADPASEAGRIRARWVGSEGPYGVAVDLNGPENGGAVFGGVGIDRDGRGVAAWSDVIAPGSDDSDVRYRLID